MSLPWIWMTSKNSGILYLTQVHVLLPKDVISTKTTQSGKVTQVHVPLPKDVISTKTTQSGKMTQVPMFTSKGCDIGRGDARRVDTQKILWQINYNFHLKKFLHKKFESNKFEPPLKKICVTNCRWLQLYFFIGQVLKLKRLIEESKANHLQLWRKFF